MKELFTDAPNARMVSEELLCCGQPAVSALEAAARNGCRTVINLRPEGELGDFDEAAAVASLGMRYVHIPVAGPQDLTTENARRLHEALDAPDSHPVMLHCGSGNRVGALLAMRARHLDGQSKDDALQTGLSAGLDPNTPLYGATRDRLSR
ncbi:MAG TPA: protein tyrosine phosphatase family protein [Gammaproteobacteria bacterium]|nr:protein tyrosine phosphatase family protein [Gammaproteobacteria bacterium]